MVDTHSGLYVAEETSGDEASEDCATTFPPLKRVTRRCTSDRAIHTGKHVNAVS
ncbi:uncharacterized protein MYCFIDRAFT_183184 [Pseudocercospora fijiensis CIRAD86]|uniref:Uncharacterized protein n=1 Tax=Pseudocercospora fijiensis (strain CIRAD86) TaxID=383855 RepID=M3A8G6_PSEFD|nr:uncharacterized protein MYCFIDRAFT_183184 [Pseudocercospora fijiensis CIRAD86]EME80916.1 hypothetical protein MYCFIDRAFT_183184 [Pseudocercospora fijiensis CIRAD86]